MAAFNKVILIGYLTDTPELKQTQTGISVASFTIGVNRRYSAEGRQETDFINIVCWRKTAEFVCRYFGKGSAILVCGSLQTRTYTDRDGIKRHASEVVADEAAFVERKSESAQTGGIPAYGAPDSGGSFEKLDPEDELPF
jgi:single-strand DNA-binding protein